MVTRGITVMRFAGFYGVVDCHDGSCYGSGPVQASEAVQVMKEIIDKQRIQEGRRHEQN